jgi:GntR family transcriptional regulator
MTTAKSNEKNRKQVPAYRQIADSLTESIKTEKLRPGDAVPSERELAASFKVSLMTARHALQELTTEGLLSRRPNVGTFVAPTKIHFNKLTSFTEEMLSRGYTPESRVLSASQTSQDEEVCSRLSLPIGSKLFRVQRLRLSGTEPFAVETCYLELKRFPGLMKEHLASRSLFSILTEEHGIKISYADEEIDATSSDSKTAKLLNVRSGTPVLRIRQVLYDTAVPIVYSIALYRSDRHSLLVRRFR